MSTPKDVIGAHPGDTPLDYTQNDHSLRYRRRPDGGFTAQYLLCEGNLAENRGPRTFRCRHGFVNIISDDNGSPMMDFQAPASPRNQRTPTTARTFRADAGPNPGSSCTPANR